MDVPTWCYKWDGMGWLYPGGTYKVYNTSAVQNIQKLSEPPGTASMVVKLCIVDIKNRKIA